MFGQGVDGNIVDVGIGEFVDGVKGNVVGDFQCCLVCGNFYCFVYQVGGEVIEYNDIGFGF